MNPTQKAEQIDWDNALGALGDHLNDLLMDADCVLCSIDCSEHPRIIHLSALESSLKKASNQLEDILFAIGVHADDDIRGYEET